MPAATVIIPNMALSISQQISQRGSASAAAVAAAATASSASVAHPQQLFQELRQYSRLLSRRGLAAALETELLALAKQVSWTPFLTKCSVQVAPVCTLLLLLLLHSALDVLHCCAAWHGCAEYHRFVCCLLLQIDAYLEHLQQEFDQLETGHSSQSAASTGRLMHGEA
jgi:hypothetical protein